MSLAQIAREIDRTPKQTKKLLRKVRYIGLKGDRYDASALEVLKALLNIPHRHIGTDDWLTNYLGGTDA